eukprot:jgi/Psemu1/47327/gm1.47327_g
MPNIYDHATLDVHPTSLAVPVTHMLNAVHDITTASSLPSINILPSCDNTLPPSLPNPLPPSRPVPTKPHTKPICLNDLHTTPTPTPLLNIDHGIATLIRAQIDTGADITCTNMIGILHDYRPYTLNVTGAIGNKSVFPIGKGYIHIPTTTPASYAHICCVYFSPSLTSYL